MRLLHTTWARAQAFKYGGPRSKTWSTYICLKDGGALCERSSLSFPRLIHKYKSRAWICEHLPIWYQKIQVQFVLARTWKQIRRSMTLWALMYGHNSFTFAHQTYKLELELTRHSHTTYLNVITSCCVWSQGAKNLSTYICRKWWSFISWPVHTFKLKNPNMMSYHYTLKFNVLGFNLENTLTKRSTIAPPPSI